MAGNPNPQHNPTDGLGVGAYVTLLDNNSGPSKLTKVGSQVALSPGNAVGGTQYACTLSVGGLPNGTAQTCQLVPLIVDVKGNTYSAINTPTYKCYGTPQNSGWYNPKPYQDSTSTSPVYNANIASVSSQRTGDRAGPRPDHCRSAVPDFRRCHDPGDEHQHRQPHDDDLCSDNSNRCGVESREKGPISVGPARTFSWRRK